MQDIPLPFQSRASPHRGHVGESIDLLFSTLSVLRVLRMKYVIVKMR
jgi:hypothetical protein